MSGISMVLNTAKQALAAQQIGLNVTGHNIANVNTPNFSRQTAVHITQRPMALAGLNMGSGVDVDTILRSSDQLLDERLVVQMSTLSANQEAESYIDVLETLFNETSEDGLSKEIASLWNSFHDISNSPTGASERLAVFDTGVRFAELFNTLSGDIRNLEFNTNKELESAVSEINTLTAQIAAVNLDIVANSANGTANDQLDMRNDLVQKLATLIDIKTFEQPNGALSINTGSGHTLVYQGDTFDITMSAGDLYWEGSLGTQVNITDKITGGKVSGWLDMRDEVFPKYRHDLDVLAEEYIWSINLQHSQGVGLDFFDSTVTGTYDTDDSLMLSTLAFGDRIDYTGDFRMWVHDNNTYPPTASSVTVDMAVSAANPTYGAGAFNTVSGVYDIEITSGGTVGTDPINLRWRQGGGGWTTVAMAGNSVAIDGQTVNFTNGDQLVSGNRLTVNTDGAGAPDPLDVSVTGTANGFLDTYRFEVTTGGAVGGVVEIAWSNSITTGTVSLDAATTTATVDGMALTFNSGTLLTGDVFTIATDSIGDPTAGLASDWHWTLDSFRDAFNMAADAVAGGGPGSGYITAAVTTDNTLSFTQSSSDYSYAFSDDGASGFTDAGLTAAMGINTFFDGDSALNIAMNTTLNDKDLIAAGRINGDTGDYGVGDNRNVIAIADIQYESRDMVQWVFDRGSAATASILNATQEGYFQGMVGSMGIKAASLRRDSEFNEILTNRINEQRDSISGVSLDEEMVNLMKYQHAFAVASKLLSTADEMMATLIASR